MLRIGLLLGAICLVATGAAQSAQVIRAEKLTKPQLRAVLKKAPDDAIIEFRGERKTKAQWRSEQVTKFRPMDAARLKALESEREAMVVRRQNQLDGEEVALVEAENARAMAKFSELRGLQPKGEAQR